MLTAAHLQAQAARLTEMVGISLLAVCRYARSGLGQASRRAGASHCGLLRLGMQGWKPDAAVRRVRVCESGRCHCQRMPTHIIAEVPHGVQRSCEANVRSERLPRGLYMSDFYQAFFSRLKTLSAVAVVVSDLSSTEFLTVSCPNYRRPACRA